MYMYMVGTASNMVARCGLDAREHLARIETRMQHQRQSVHERAVEDDVAVDVRARERRHDGVELRLQVHLSGQGTVEHDRTVGLHRALGVAGRTRRVADGRNVFGRAGNHFELVRCPPD